MHNIHVSEYTGNVPEMHGQAGNVNSENRVEFIGKISRYELFAVSNAGNEKEEHPAPNPLYIVTMQFCACILSIRYIQRALLGAAVKVSVTRPRSMQQLLDTLYPVSWVLTSNKFVLILAGFRKY